MSETSYTPSGNGKRGRQAGTKDTVKIPIKELLELGGDKLIVQVNRKWLESLVELYSTDGVEEFIAHASDGNSGDDEKAVAEESRPSFQVEEEL